MDDIRIVEKTVNNFDEDGNFTQDFESVVQGLYPFVLGSAQGVSDLVTHLSELNDPYTQEGWNGKVTDDVIDGEWSLKHHGSDTGIIYQTIPQNFRFEAGKVYTVEFDYQSGPDKAYAMVVGDGTSYTLPSEDDYLEQARGETKHVTMQVIGSGSGQTWIGLYEDGSQANGTTSTGENDFILDNLTITVDEDAVAVAIDTTELYLGETAQLYGSNLDQVELSVSDESVITLDEESLTVSAVGAGTATITASLPDGSETVFEITVTDQVIVEIADQLEMTATANTEQSGTPGSYAVDRDTDTRWHSQWSGFTVSEDNPAILTIDLGNTISFDGFNFLQRNDGNVNGMVYQYRYAVLDAEGNTVYSGDSVTVPDELRSSGTWVTCQFAETLTGKYLVIYVEQGGNDFASLQEVVPFVIQKVAESASLTDMTINVGQTAALEVGHEEGTLLKGLVWSSSDEETVSVDQNGNVTGIKEGSAVISISNAAGLYAECTVTVSEAALDTSVLESAVAAANEIDLTQYEDGETKDAFTEALENAQNVLANASSQEAVDEALSQLEAAYEALLEMGEAGDLEAPSAPEDLKVTETTASSITVEWTAAKDNTGVAGYEIYVDGNSAGTVDADTTSAKIDNLAEDTEYEISVKAYDEAGNYSVAAEVTARTEKESGSSGSETSDSDTSDTNTGDAGASGSSGTTTGSPSVSSVKTGDAAPIAAMAAVLCAAAGAVAVTVTFRRRKR